MSRIAVVDVFHQPAARHVRWIAAVWLILTVAPVATLTGPLFAQSKPPDIQQRVDALIRDLDADDRSTRVRAERGLLELGPEILPNLPAPDASASISVREAVRRIRIHLEQKQARESVQASRVTLHGEYRLDRVLRALADQSANPINLDDLPPAWREKRLSLAYDNLEFWSALDDLLAREDLVYGFDADSPSLVIAPRPADAPKQRAPATQAGPFRVALSSVSLRPNFAFAGKPIVRIGLGISTEPRLRPLFLKYAVGDFSLHTPQMLQLEPFSPHARVELPVENTVRHVELMMDFLVPPLSTIPEQVDLKGKFVMETAAGTEAIRFRDLDRAEGVARRRGGVTVKLERVEFRRIAGGERELTVRVSVSYDTGGPAFESHRAWMLHNEVYLETEKDPRISQDGPVEVVRQGPGTFAVEYTFKGLANELPAYRFVYVAPVLLVNVPISFALKGIPVSP